MVDSAHIRELATRRENLHRHHASSRPLSVGYEYIGLLGEAYFAEEMGLSLDAEDRPGGDKGVDFITSIGTIDVKTARKAYNLIHEQGKNTADILVLAQYSDEKDSIELIGWQYGSILLARPVKDFGFGVTNHYMPARELRKMEELKSLLSP